MADPNDPQNQALQNVNTTATYNGVSPGVGAPGSTPQTDQTNLNLAAAMSRADQFNGAQPSGGFQPNQTVDALRASRDVPDMIGNAIEARRAALLDGITKGYVPGQNAVSVTPKIHQQMIQELGTLTSAARENAIERAHQTAETFQNQQDTMTANSATKFISGLAAINADRDRFPLGSTARADAIMQNAHDNSDGFMTAKGQHFAQLDARLHDSHAATFGSKDNTYKSRDELMNANPDAKPKQNSRGGWYDSGEISPEATAKLNSYSQRAYGIPTDSIRNPTSASVVDKDGNGDINGNFVKISTKVKGKLTDATISKDDYLNKYGGKLAPESMPGGQQNAAAGTTAAPTATPTATPNVSQADYQNLKPGQTYWWNGQQLTKK